MPSLFTKSGCVALTGHTSAETAYVVDDYPYGFRLRCKIRYWLEYKPSKGFRLVSQTTNPKKGDVWNKPKASTYSELAAAMYLDEQGHVQWDTLHNYSSVDYVCGFVMRFPDADLTVLRERAAAQVQYLQACLDGRRGQYNIEDGARYERDQGLWRTIALHTPQTKVA